MPLAPPRHKAIKTANECRPKTAARGYGGRHRKWRKMILNRDRVCQECKRNGITSIATEADHIKPLNDGGDWTMENGQGLCKKCHGRKTRAEHA